MYAVTKTLATKKRLLATKLLMKEKYVTFKKVVTKNGGNQNFGNGKFVGTKKGGN
jgi:hypothetical protein